jgi:hypothetical protein
MVRKVCEHALADEVGGGLGEASGHDVGRVVADQARNKVALIEVLDDADVRVERLEVLDHPVEVGHHLGLVLHEAQRGDAVLAAGHGAAARQRKDSCAAGEAGRLEQGAAAEQCWFRHRLATERDCAHSAEARAA